MYLKTIFPINYSFNLAGPNFIKNTLLCIKSLLSLNAEAIWIRGCIGCHLKIKSLRKLDNAQCMLIFPYILEI